MLLSAGIPQGETPADHTVEQMPPIRSWGNNFAMTPTPNVNNDEEYMIVAALDSTRVLINTDGTREEVSSTTRACSSTRTACGWR